MVAAATAFGYYFYVTENLITQQIPYSDSFQRGYQRGYSASTPPHKGTITGRERSEKLIGSAVIC
jgi:hypothetical protein